MTFLIKGRNVVFVCLFEWGLKPLQTYFSHFKAVTFLSGKSQSNQRELLTMSCQLKELYGTNSGHIGDQLQ